MNRSKWMRESFCALGLVALGAACGTNPRASETRQAELAEPALSLSPALIVGTVLGAANGQPIEGAWIEAPGGETAETDAEGRFRLRGVPLGTTGFLEATYTGDLVGRNLLRPLKPGELEVVIYLRAGPKGEAPNNR